MIHYEELKYFYQVDGTYLNIYSMVEGLLADERTITAERFYSSLWEQVQAYWDAHGLSEGEREYWTWQMGLIQKPYLYRHPWPGTGKLMDFSYTLLSLLSVAAAMYLCTVFSMEDLLNALSTENVAALPSCTYPTTHSKLSPDWDHAGPAGKMRPKLSNTGPQQAIIPCPTSDPLDADRSVVMKSSLEDLTITV